MKCTLLDRAIKYKASDKGKPTTQKNEVSIKDLISKFKQIYRICPFCGFCHIY